MRSKSFLIPAVAFAASVQPLMSRADAALSPSASPATQPQWVLDQSGYYCALAAKLLGNPASTLVFRTLPGTGIYDVSVIRDDGQSAVLSRHGKVSLLLLPSGTAETEDADTIKVDATVYLSGVSKAFLDAFRNSSALAITADGRSVLNYRLPLGNGRAMDALEDCVDGKLIDAGADPAAFQPGATAPKPIGDKYNWLQLPPTQRVGNPVFHLAAALGVGPDGKPTDCTVLEISGNLDGKAACTSLMEHARYEPARDPKGTPVRTVTVYVLDEAVTNVIRYAD